MPSATANRGPPAADGRYPRGRDRASPAVYCLDHDVSKTYERSVWRGRRSHHFLLPWRAKGGGKRDSSGQLDQRVVRQRLLRPLLPLADHVKAIGQLPGGLTEAADPGAGKPPRSRRPPRARGSGAARLPKPSAGRRRRVPVPGNSYPTEEPHLARLRLEDAGIDHAVDGVFLARASVSASPNGPRSIPYCSNHASAQRVSASKSPSCSASASSSAWLMSASAVRTDIADPSARAPWRSGRTPPCRAQSPPVPGRPARCARAAGDAERQELGLERVEEFASVVERGPRALAAHEHDGRGESVGSRPHLRVAPSVRIGHVPVIAKPEAMQPPQASCPNRSRAPRLSR